MNKLITVLVSIYKSGAYLHRKLLDLERQSLFSDCNIVLLNCQNLDDESHLYAWFKRKHNNVTVVEYTRHINLYQTWNHGILLTSSKYITNFNVDDMNHPLYLEACVNYLDNDRYCSVVSSQILVTDIPNQTWPNWKTCSRLPNLTYPNSTAGPCPVWRRDLHGKYGYFGDYAVIGDADMWERWHSNNVEFGMIYEDYTLYYISPKSLERRTDNNGTPLRELDLKQRNNATT